MDVNLYKYKFKLGLESGSDGDIYGAVESLSSNDGFI